MKKVVLGVIGVFSVVIIITTIANAQESFKEGKWEITLINRVEGLSPEVAAMMNNQSTVIKRIQCLTNQNPITQPKSLPSGCSLPQIQKNGNKISYQINCNNGDYQMKQTGEETFDGDTMQGLIKSHQTVKGMNIDSTMEITGRYIGPC